MPLALSPTRTEAVNAAMDALIREAEAAQKEADLAVKLRLLAGVRHAAWAAHEIITSAEQATREEALQAARTFA
jgi:hypothetical protein